MFVRYTLRTMSHATQSLPAPTVTRLFTTPIKGFALNEPDAVTLNENGAVGDRDFFILDDTQRLFSITRTGVFGGWRAHFDSEQDVLSLTSPDGQLLQDTVIEGPATVTDFWESRDVPGHVVGGRWSEQLSNIAGRPVVLVRTTRPGDGYDERPVTLAAEESVSELARATSSDPIDIRRFRMLINLAGVEPYEEETWSGLTVRIGSALLRMGGPVPRCNATTRNPDTGKRDLKTLKLIAESRGMRPNEFGEDLNLGAYASVIEPGSVRVGDAVLVEHSPS